MRRGGVYDPRFIQRMMPVASSLASLARCTIFRPDGERPTWTPGVGVSDSSEQIWAGVCRVQPNMDWRARVRDFDGEYDATTAVRIDLPMNKNEFGATLDANNNIVAYSPDPIFALGDHVIIVTVVGPGQETLLDKTFTVRNALPSTTMFQHNLLCDIGTSLHG